MDDDPQTAGVIVPPPLLFAGALTFGLAIGRLAPGQEMGRDVARFLGAASVASGVAAGLAALRTLRAAGNDPSPFRPVAALVTGGVFRWSRNPAYFGATAVYVGIAMYARSLPAFVLLPIVLALLDRLVVTPEERYLEKRFGDDYRAYRDAVPRWF